MRIHPRFARLAWAGAFLCLLLGVNQAGGCACSECPEPEPAESGNYEIIGLAYDIGPKDQWLIDTVTGAQVMVDRDAGEVTIRYIKDGSTIQVRYTIESSPP